MTICFLAGSTRAPTSKMMTTWQLDAAAPVDRPAGDPRHRVVRGVAVHLTAAPGVAGDLARAVPAAAGVARTGARCSADVRSLARAPRQRPLGDPDVARRA